MRRDISTIEVNGLQLGLFYMDLDPCWIPFVGIPGINARGLLIKNRAVAILFFYIFHAKRGYFTF